MMRRFLKTRGEAWSRWWRAPVSGRDRVIGALVGGIGTFWIALIVRLVIGPMPVAGTSALTWAFAGALLGAVLGVAFPKPVTAVCFPFSTIG